MLKQNIHGGLALVLVWAVALAFTTAIIFKVGETDFAYLYSGDTGVAAVGTIRR